MTKTEENLKESFAGESQVRNKYTYFAKVARTQGFHYVAKIFEETAENEVQHAKEEFKLLKGIGDTTENLKEAIKGEHYENSEMYPGMKKDAEEEGNNVAAKLFGDIAEVEKHHESRYIKLLEMLDNGTLYKRDKEIEWKCSKCGHIHKGMTPPDACPVCKHETEYFEPEDMCGL